MVLSALLQGTPDVNGKKCGLPGNEWGGLIRPEGWGGCRPTPPWGGEGGWIGFWRKVKGGVGEPPHPGFRVLFRNSYLTAGVFFSGNKWMGS